MLRYKGSMTGAQRLATWIDRRMSRAEFARKLGVSSAVVTQWCTEVRRPGRDLAADIQEMTRIPVSAWRAPASTRGSSRRLQ